ncbi:MAG: Epoxyqueuosine reductase [Planctomycetota bacterium]|jgi:epoxyqueuosine reductase
MVTSEEIKAAARELGFSLTGICQAAIAPGFDCLADWLAAGYAGEMSYLASRYDAYAHPRHVLDGVRTLVMLGWEYRVDEPILPEAGQGRVSRYAWSDRDYHEVIRERLNLLATRLATLAPGCRVRGVVDTAPLLEREFAQLAGIGWIGKNTLLIHREVGSWFFLAALLTDLPLTPDVPWESDHCGSCRACLDACPTQAFPAPYVLDASRCVSYLTIEHREPVPPSLRAGLGNWLFGCDICQEVCPWNQHAARRRSNASFEPAVAADTSQPARPWNTFRPRSDANPMDLIGLFHADEATMRARFRHTPLWRAKRRGLLRNAAYVLGNQRVPQAVDALLGGLEDAEPLVRGACAWALGQFLAPNRPSSALLSSVPSSLPSSAASSRPNAEPNAGPDPGPNAGPNAGPNSAPALVPWPSNLGERLAARLAVEQDAAVRNELTLALGAPWSG